MKKIIAWYPNGADDYDQEEVIKGTSLTKEEREDYYDKLDEIALDDLIF